jgi:hypothetical protein
LKSHVKEDISDVLAALNQRGVEAKEEQRKGLHFKLFPQWPDDRRGAPNALIRSAVFGVVRKGRRKRIVKMPIASPAGYEVTLTGWRLDQHDCDIWLEVMHLARDTKPGDSVRFSWRGLLRSLGRSDDGSANREWLKSRLEALAETTIGYKGQRSFGVLGALISSFHVDDETGEGVVRTNPEIRPLWESITHLDIRQRQALGQNQLAKAMHAVLSSHADWLPMRLDTLMERVGAEYDRLRAFKESLKEVLEDFVRRGWIHSYAFTPGTGGELLEIDKIPTPTQQRILAKRTND